VNTRMIDPSMKVRYLLENRPARANLVMSNAFGFGGTNCSLVLGRAGG
jgi:3-oxoacyl-[acyl-carrier-protein] synthase-1